MPTRREAIKKALAFEPVTLVPYNLDFTKDMRARLAKHFGRDDVDEAVGNYILQINIGSNAGAEVNRVAAGLMKPLGGSRFEDEFGVLWDKSGGDDIGVPANRVLAEPDADLLGTPDPADPVRWRGYDDVLATAGDRYVLVCFSSPLFQRAWFMRGMAEWLMDMAVNEDFVNAVLDRLMDFSIALVREAARRGGADGIFFYDDYAQQTGLLFSPEMFRRYYAPRLTNIFGAAKDCGLDVFLHSCGDVSSVLEDIRTAGANVFNPFQPEVMDVETVARRFAGRLAFYGGISTQRTMPYGTPDDVRREVRHRISLFRNRGGYILAAAHALQRDVPLENVLALLDAARES
ncbi:MAG: uroporphyrinogen decarboxylase family protein [Planctomycetota bacterium]